jgi:hypothetical protein
MRSGSNFVNNYGREGGGLSSHGDPPTGYLCPCSSSDIPLPHGTFTRRFHTRTTTSSCDQQADTKYYTPNNSGSKKVYHKQVNLCDPKDAKLNSKKHNPNKLLGFSASTFAELQQKHHMSTGVECLHHSSDVNLAISGGKLYDLAENGDKIYEDCQI